LSQRCSGIKPKSLHNLEHAAANWKIGSATASKLSWMTFAHNTTSQPVQLMRTNTRLKITQNTPLTVTH